MSDITRKAGVGSWLAPAIICFSIYWLMGGAIRPCLQPMIEPVSAQAGVFEIELPEIQLAPTSQPELIIPSPNINTINIHILRPQADGIDYGRIFVKLNGEGTAGLYETRLSERGKLVEMKLNSLPGFKLAPGRNTVEIEATNNRNRRFYASFVLSTGSNRLKEFKYQSVSGSNPEQKTPPEIALLEPESGVVFPAGRVSIKVQISGVATCAGANNSIARVTIGGQVVTLKRGAQVTMRKIGLLNEINRVAFDLAYTVSAGTRGVPVVAVDGFGNRTTLEIPVRVGDAPAPVQFSGKKYALIAGVSTFQHQDVWIRNLRYADVDARSVYQFLQTRGGGGFRQDDMTLLLNEEATLARYREALSDFVARPGPDDLLVVFLATHGGPDENARQNLYFVMHDTERERMAVTALAMKDLQSFLQQNVRARRMLLFVDTCQSAGLTETPTVATRGQNNLANLYVEKLLFREEGRAVITASDVNESSMEGPKWGGGHGVFTHFLIEGLRGGADADADTLVTLGELFRFVRLRVRVETQFNQNPRMLIGTNENLTVAAVASLPRKSK